MSIWVSFDFQNAFSPQLPRFFGFTRAPEKLSSAMERPVSAAPGVFGGAKNGNALQSVYGNLELEISSSLSRFMLIRKFQGKKRLLLSAFNAILVLFSMQTTWPRMNLCFHSVMMLMLLMYTYVICWFVRKGAKVVRFKVC